MVGESLRTVQRTRSETTSDRRTRIPLDTGPPVLVPPRVWPRVRAGSALDAFERARHAVHLVAGERFDPYRVVREARRTGHRPREVLASSRVARAFTAAQLATLVHDRLVPQLHGAHVLTVADPLAMLVTDEVGSHEAETLLDDILDRLRQIADDVPVLVTQRPRDTPLLRTLRRATRPARAGVHGVRLPGGDVGWTPSRQTTLDAYRPPPGVST